MFDVAETDRLLTTTRAVRRRLDLDRPVEREVVLDCLRIAIQAPTASNDQNWRWMVVTDPAKRAALADLYRENGLDYLDQARRKEQDPQTARVYERAYEFAQNLHRVPVLVIPCIDRRFDGAPLGVSAAAFASIIPAAWSFQLALRSRGLGSAPHLGHVRPRCLERPEQERRRPPVPRRSLLTVPRLWLVPIALLLSRRRVLFRSRQPDSALCLAWQCLHPRL